MSLKDCGSSVQRPVVQPRAKGRVRELPWCIRQVSFQLCFQLYFLFMLFLLMNSFFHLSHLFSICRFKTVHSCIHVLAKTGVTVSPRWLWRFSGAESSVDGPKWVAVCAQALVGNRLQWFFPRREEPDICRTDWGPLWLPLSCICRLVKSNFYHGKGWKRCFLMLIYLPQELWNYVEGSFWWDDIGSHETT